MSIVKYCLFLVTASLTLQPPVDVTVENMAVHSREKSDQLDQLMLMNDLEKHQSVNVIESWHCSAEQTSVVKEVEQLSMMVRKPIM